MKLKGVLFLALFFLSKGLFPQEKGPVQTELNPTEKILKESEKRKRQTAANLSQDLDLLEDIRTQSKELSKRKKALDLQQLQVEGLLAELNGRIQYLENLRIQIKNLMEQRDEEEDKNLSKLSKMYENMNSAVAAKLMARLDPYIAISIFTKMKPKGAVQIFNLLDTPTAYLVSANFHRLWKENQLKETTIGGLIKLIESLPPNKAAGMLDTFDNEKIIHVLSRIKKTKIEDIIYNLSSEKKKFVFSNFQTLINTTSEDLEKDKKLAEIYSRLKAPDAAESMADVSEDKVVNTIQVLDKDKAAEIFKNFTDAKREAISNYIFLNFKNGQLENGEEKYKRLLYFYENLSSVLSAKHFQKLGIDFTVDTFSQMNKKVTSKIFQELDKNYAARVSKGLMAYRTPPPKE